MFKVDDKLLINPLCFSCKNEVQFFSEWLFVFKDFHIRNYYCVLCAAEKKITENNNEFLLVKKIDLESQEAELFKEFILK